MEIKLVKVHFLWTIGIKKTGSLYYNYLPIHFIFKRNAQRVVDVLKLTV